MNKEIIERGRQAEAEVLRRLNELEGCKKLIKHIQDALGTEETGVNLIIVARNAHNAEMELAAIKRKENE